MGKAKRIDNGIRLGILQFISVKTPGAIKLLYRNKFPSMQKTKMEVWEQEELPARLKIKNFKVPFAYVKTRTGFKPLYMKEGK